MSKLSLKSPAFEENTPIPAKYTCDNIQGSEINPPLLISGVPEDCKSLVLIMDDPDVPKNLKDDGIWDHWVKFNIPPETVEIKEGEEPEGVSGIGTSENLFYHGPCPPDGEHRYFFRLYALDTRLSLGEGATKKEVVEAMSDHVLDEAALIGTYNRHID